MTYPIDNDAIVVLALKTIHDKMTHHGFLLRAKAMGIIITRSDCHNMLHRALGRVKYTGSPKWEWSLTAAGLEYRKWVREVMRRLLDATTDT